MKRITHALILSFGVGILWASLATRVQGFVDARGGFGSGIGKGWVQFRGQVLCANCTLQDLRTAPRAPHRRFYQVDHRLGRVVMEANPEQIPLAYHRLWLKSGDQAFAMLTAEENFFKEIEVSGLLREYLPTAGTLDLATVRIREEERGF